MDRFILAENPMHPAQSGCFIIQMIDPITIIGCIEGHEVIPGRRCLHESFRNSDGITEEWTLYIHHLFTTNMNAADDNLSLQIAEAVMKRAWRWYRAYLEWEDEQIDTQQA